MRISRTARRLVPAGFTALAWFCLCPSAAPNTVATATDSPFTWSNRNTWTGLPAGCPNQGGPDNASCGGATFAVEVNAAGKTLVLDNKAGNLTGVVTIDSLNIGAGGTLVWETHSPQILNISNTGGVTLGVTNQGTLEVLIAPNAHAAGTSILDLHGQSFVGAGNSGSLTVGVTSAATPAGGNAVQALVQNVGSISNSGSIIVSNGAIPGSGTASALAAFNMSPSAAGILTNTGAIQIGNFASTVLMGTLTSSAYLTGLDNSGNITVRNNSVNGAGSSANATAVLYLTSPSGSYANSGTIAISAEAVGTTSGSDVAELVLGNSSGPITVTNTGAIQLNQPGGGTPRMLLAGDVTFQGAGAILLNAGSAQILSAGGGVTPKLTIGSNQALSGSGAIGNGDIDAAVAGGGALTVTGPMTIHTAGAFTNAGAVSVSAGQALTLMQDYSQSGGVTNVNGTISAPGHTLTFTGGALDGSGAIAAKDVILGSGATLNPGNSPGTLTIFGNYQQAGTLNIEIGGTNPGEFDLLTVTGGVTFLPGATLNAVLINGFGPTIGDTFNVISFASLSGLDNLTVHAPGFTWWRNGGYFTLQANAAPEPATYALLGLGCLGIGLYGRRGGRRR